MMRHALVLLAMVTAFPLFSEPVKVIFDTDMYTDFDDVGALACLHALADVGECEILATVVNTRDSMSVAMCEIVNAYYGRPGIPVGCVKGIGVAGDPDGVHARRFGRTVEKYAKWVRHRNSSDAPDAAEVYRKVLEAQPDDSVVICSVGFLTNMRKLVELDRDLVARKVKRWVAMACAYPRGREYNSMTDWESSAVAIGKWPTPIVFTDFQYGMDCFAGRRLAGSSVQDSPVADVFRANAADFNGAAGRSAWDETAVLIAVRGVDRYFNAHRGTYRMVGEKGDDEWISDEAGGPHVRVTEKVNKIEVGKVIDDLICRVPLKTRTRPVEDAPGYSCWPMIQSVGNRLVCVYTMGKAHDPGERNRGTFARTSDDGGLTWSERVTVCNDAGCAESPVAKGLDENGAALFIVRRYGPKSLMAVYRTVDGRKFELVSEPKLKGPMMQITDIVRVEGVGLMAFWFGGSYSDDDRPRWSGVITSGDNGVTWQQRPICENVKRADWPTEPSFVSLGNGRLLTIARCEDGRAQFQLTSEDNGLNWKIAKTNIGDVAASTPSLVYDAKTGIIHNYYFQRGAGVLKVRKAKADDVWGDPLKWGEPTVIGYGEKSRPHDSGNANAVAMGDRHYVTYYAGNPTDCRILVTEVDPGE